MEMDAGRGAGAVAGTGGRYSGAQALRAVGTGSFRSRQAMVGSRRRHPGSDRFLHLLRTANAATWAPKVDAAGAGGRELSSLLAAGRGVGNCALEFSNRNSLRNGVGGSCYRKR